MGKQSGSEVFRITGARQGLAEDVRGRQRRYVISMSVRTVSVVAAAALWNVERYVAIVGLALGVLLPYVAVVIANAGRENSPRCPRPSSRHRPGSRSAPHRWRVTPNPARRRSSPSEPLIRRVTAEPVRPCIDRSLGGSKLKKSSNQS